ncbi:hypothetical protein [Brevundimonas sp. M20]|uniref:hypothetical protein n=1 Tax=Brevundimonas sp. M20 TaxID=2591463 RepID=UPI0011463187|nr:hypothetical protein [Brevundimonas sp. M20]QDH74089.1 hypothetical protein FKQ52_12065 [Brevundimonas sp. M20]
MKVTVASAAALMILAGAPVAQAQTATQTPPPVPASDFTRDLNGGPPRPAEYLAPAPAPVVTPAPAAATPTPAPAPATITPRPATAAPTPAPAMTAPRPAAPTTRPPAAATPSPTPRPAAPTTPAPATAAPAPTPTPEPVAPPPPPAVSTVTVLDASARAALPFTVDLPAGFQIVTGRPGPDFRIYTIRRGDRSFVMIYAGPASQYPIYSGEQVEAGGRTSVVSTEDGQRHAVEHLFQRTSAPNEIHIWTMTLDGPDRALAEQIAQSVDVR